MRNFSFMTFVAIFIAVAVFSCEKKPKPDKPDGPVVTNPNDTTGGGSTGGGTESDVFVSKKVETSTFLLEELTGIDCGYCPDGHKMADKLAAITFPEKFFIINVHDGSYSIPRQSQPADLRTDYGSAIRTYSNLTGFPAGMINRSVFPAPWQQKTGSPAMSRGSWEAAAMSIANNTTYVNVAAKTTISSAERTLICKVQVYYTSDAPVVANNINVAILQNEIIAGQSGGQTYYPERVTPDGKYRHMHVLRHLVTGQWGEQIDSDMKKDDLYEKTFTWTIPGDIKTIPIPLEDLEILVFVTEGMAAPVAKVCKSTIEIK